nr:hypothetical protein [Tanacetum cinerariifolium]
MDIELVVMMFKPQTLSIAYSLSKLQFETNEASKKKYKPPILPTPRFNNHYVGGTQINSPKPLAVLALNANWRNQRRRKADCGLTANDGSMTDRGWKDISAVDQPQIDDGGLCMF